MEKREDYDAREFRDSLLAYQNVDQVKTNEDTLTAEDEARAEGEGMPEPALDEKQGPVLEFSNEDSE